MDAYVLDATLLNDEDGLLCFCPVELDESGEVTSIMTGLSYLSDTPPDGTRFLGVVHGDGQDACNEWCAANADVVERLRHSHGDLAEQP